VDEESERPVFMVGQSMEYVDFSAFRQVLEYSTLKAIILYQNVPLKELMMESKHFINEVQRKQDKVGQMLKNIVVFNHLLLMQNIVELNEEGKI
jgi:hypothetical protein